jgi:AcrR family transcriptional regulator
MALLGNEISTKAGVHRKRLGRPQASAPSGDELREVILLAAARVYARKGYHGSSVEKILDAADTFRPTFYRYFKSRYDVIDVVIERVNDDLKVFVARAPSDVVSLDQLLESVANAYFA